MFSIFHLFFRLGIAWVRALSFLPSPCHFLLCVCGLLSWWSCHATALLLLRRHFSFISLFHMGLQAKAPTNPLSTSFPFWAPLANIPTMLTHFPHPYHFLALLDHIPIVSTHFSHLYLFLGSIGPHSCCASPFHSSSFLGPFTYSLHLLLSWAFAKSFRLPQPDYHILTFYYLLDLLAFLPTLWIYLLIIWASLAHLLLLYLLLFSWVCYFIYWASSTHLLLVCHLLFLWACWPLFLPFRPAGLCFTIFSSHFLYIVGFLLPLGILSKVGINIQPLKHTNCSCNSYVNTWKFFLFFLFFRGFFE